VPHGRLAAERRDEREGDHKTRNPTHIRIFEAPWRCVKRTRVLQLRRMVVAIDGPSGSGKSSAARNLARRIGFMHLDTGAIYRAFTLRALRRRADMEDEAALASLVEPEAIALEPLPQGGERVTLDGEDVTAAIRLPEVTGEIHWLARAPAVRERVTAIVRQLARGRDVVVEGRDTTTAIFPGAEVKFYVDATPEERARRRGLELAARGTPVPPAELLADIRKRDERDSTRAAGPLLRAPDAIYLDTTGLDANAVVARLAEEVERRKRR
jgi:cytidylate kinase